MLRYLRIFSIIRSNPSPREIAFGVCLAMFLGFTPLTGSITILLAMFFFIFRVNRVATLFTLPLFKLIYLAGVKYLCNAIGISLLAESGFLTGFWAWFTGLPVIALLGINYTLVTGGLVLAGALFPIVYFGTKHIAIRAGASYGNKLKATKIGAWLFGAQAAPKSVPAKKENKSSILRRLKPVNVAIIIAALIAIQLVTGLIISPFAREFIVEKLNESTGSRLMVGALNVWPLTLSISLKDVKVFDSVKADSRIAKLDNASFSMSPIGLLSARAVISRAHLSGAEFTPDGISDSGFVAPKGAKQPQAKKTTEKGPWELASALSDVGKNKDMAGRVYQIVKNAFSGKSADKAIKSKQNAKKVTKEITKLDLGEKVEFKRGADMRLLEIIVLSIDRANINIDKNVTISDADIKIRGLSYDPESGSDIRYLFIKGGLSKSGSSMGGVEIDFDKKVTNSKQSVRMNLAVKELDMAAAKSLYDKSLPVYAEKGRLNFSSRTNITNGEMNSNNRIILRGQKVAPRNPTETIFGVIPVTALCEALNNVDPLTLKFDITGSVEKPKMKGLEDSIIVLVRPYLEKVIKDKVMVEGQKLLDNLLGKK